MISSLFSKSLIPVVLTDRLEMDYLKVPKPNHDWILNTPERKEILSEGAPKHASLNLLGRGAFGSVFKAIFQDRPVALKIVKNRNDINRTENEANILGWKHRNIVRVLMIESTIKYGIIIMEHFPSQNLQQVVDEIELPLMHRIFITMDILKALAYCHKRNLVHLDVKPQNVLVAFKKTSLEYNNKSKLAEKSNRNYNCKLCDFGSSLKLDDQELRKVKAGGTIRYMSPETLRAEKLTAAADIFSLGILMWQLQQRRLPYDSIKCNEIVAFQVVKHDLRPNSDLSQFLLQNVETTSPTTQIEKCICQCFSADSRRNSKNRWKLNGLAGTPFKRGCYSAKKDVSLTLSISPNSKTGKTIQVLHSTAMKNVARNLSKDLDFVSSEESSNSESSLRLSSLFENRFNYCNELLETKEAFYNSIYESCWQAKPQTRPEINELIVKLKNVLKIEG